MRQPPVSRSAESVGCDLATPTAAEKRVHGASGLRTLSRVHAVNDEIAVRIHAHDNLQQLLHVAETVRLASNLWVS